MKNIIFSLVFIFALQHISYSQFPDILKKIPGVSDVLIDEAVTTSIKDAYPTASWLKDLDKQIYKTTDQSYTNSLDPGYYSFKFNTYCLHAGAYAPTQGMGYLLAPLKGSKAGLIKNILIRYAEHPEIDQKDVQMLIWGIEAGAKFSSYNPDFQARITPLLTTGEIASMEVDVKEIAIDLLPQKAKDILNLYKDIRNKISDPASTYEDIEQIAVKTGIPPIGPGSKNVDAGTWSSAGNGVYIRCFPHGYSKSDVEIYIPPEVTVNRDNLNRIISLDDGYYRIEFTYEDSPGSSLLNNKLPINRFKTIQLLGQSPDENMTVNDKGWYAPAQGKVTAGTPYSRESDPTNAEYSETKKIADNYVKAIEKSFSKKHKSRKFSKADVQNLTELKEIELSLKSVLNITEPSGNWYENNYSLAVNALNKLIADHESAIGKGGNNKVSSLDIQGLVFAPANTSSQRLGTSGDGGLKGNNNGNNEKKKKKCNPQITLKRLAPDYWPEPTTIFNVNVEITNLGNCTVEGIRYTLYDVSREPGRCMNDKDPDWYDTRLDFFIEPNLNAMLNVSADSLSAEGSGDITFVTIGCNDYGAYGKISVQVKIDGQWMYAKDEKSSSNYINLPYDADGNNIADTWELDNKVLGKPASWDEDSTPKNQKKDGDGMTNYEEYRGFFLSKTQGGPVEHVRTDPNKKEMFVIDDGHLLSKKAWEKASGITVYFLTQNEVYGDLAGADKDFKYRWVDFCQGYAAGNKYAINIIKVDGIIDPNGIYPDPKDAFAYALTVPPQTPKNCTKLIVMRDRVLLSITKQNDTLQYILNLDPKKKTIDYYGWKFKRKQVQDFLDFFKDLSELNLFVDYQMVLTMIHEMGHGCGTIHHGGGVKGKEGTGAEWCPMRYISILDQMKWIKIIPKFKSKDDFNSWEFCKTVDNCWGQLNVNDR
jgi:hypothetical protein